MIQENTSYDFEELLAWSEDNKKEFIDLGPPLEEIILDDIGRVTIKLTYKEPTW